MVWVSVIGVKIYQDWVFAEVSPELETSRVNQYDITPIIMFRFEALFGER